MIESVSSGASFSSQPLPIITIFVFPSSVVLILEDSTKDVISPSNQAIFARVLIFNSKELKFCTTQTHINEIKIIPKNVKIFERNQDDFLFVFEIF